MRVHCTIITLLVSLKFLKLKKKQNRMLTEYLPGESRDGDNLVEIVWLGEEGSGGSRSLTEEAGGGGGAGA